MPQLEVTNRFTVDATPERLWEVMVDEFLDVAHWASGLDGSGPNPALDGAPAPDGATTPGRSCVVPGLGATDERFTVLEPERFRFGYSVRAEKLPSFVTDMENTWSFRQLDGGRTEVTQRLTAEAHGVLGRAMRPLLRMQFQKLLSTLQEDLEAYATTGEVSARKAAELVAAR